MESWIEIRMVDSCVISLNGDTMNIAGLYGTIKQAMFAKKEFVEVYNNNEMLVIPIKNILFIKAHAELKETEHD